MFAVFFSNAMQSIQQGMWEKMLNTTMSFTGYIQIQAIDFWDQQILDNGFETNSELENGITTINNIKRVTSRIQSYALSAYKDQSRFVQITCLNPDFEKDILNLKNKLDTGELITNNDNQILIGKGVAEYFCLTVGDTLSLIGQGYHGQSANGNFVVKGIVKYGPPEINSRLIIMPFKLAQYHFGAENIVTSYNIYLNKTAKLKSTAEDIKAHIGKNYRVITWKEMMPELEQAYQADVAGNLIFLGVLYLIISFGIFGTILMMTAERMYEFGVMISIGMKRIKIIGILVLEALFLSIIGILIGSILSIPLMYYFKVNPIPLTGDAAGAMAEYGFEAVVISSTNPNILLYNGITVMIITGLIVFYPLIVISKLNPVNAMKK
jgi:ABC-type lipoprotein release transport system permease subunit